MTVKFRRTPTSPQSYATIAAIDFGNNQENLIGFSIFNEKGLPIAVISVDQNFYLSSGIAFRDRVVTGLEVRGVTDSNLYLSLGNLNEFEQIEELSYNSWNRVNESLNTIRNNSSLFLTTCTLSNRANINGCILDDSKFQMKGMLIKDPELGKFIILYDQTKLSQLSFFIGDTLSFGYGATNYRAGETPTDGASSISISSTFHNSIPNGPNPGWSSSQISGNETAQILDSFSEKIIPIKIHSTKTKKISQTTALEESSTRQKTLTHLKTHSPSFTRVGISRFTAELLSGSKTIRQHTEEVSSTISDNSSTSEEIETGTSTTTPSTQQSRSSSNSKRIESDSTSHQDETAIIAGKVIGITLLASAFLAGIVLLARKVRKTMKEDSREEQYQETTGGEDDAQELPRVGEVDDEFFGIGITPVGKTTNVTPPNTHRHTHSEGIDMMTHHPHVPTRNIPSTDVSFSDGKKITTRSQEKSSNRKL